jgi:hypothetical protein
MSPRTKSPTIGCRPSIRVFCIRKMPDATIPTKSLFSPSCDTTCPLRKTTRCCIASSAFPVSGRRSLNGSNALRSRLVLLLGFPDIASFCRQNSASALTGSADGKHRRKDSRSVLLGVWQSGRSRFNCLAYTCRLAVAIDASQWVRTGACS